jgi:peptidoglycan/LPS O-acetylase OafA/YrhL
VRETDPLMATQSLPELAQPSRLRRAVAVLRAGWRDLWHPAAGNLPALDGARAMAVLLVIASHVGAEWERANLPRLWALKLPVFYFGWTGVDLFFVLSGFLIGGQLWRELDRSGRVDFPAFFTRRAFRIWPLYFFHLAFLWLFATSYRPTWPDWLLVSNYFESGYSRGWSLSTEEHFYIVAPLLALLLFRSARRWVAPALVSLLVIVVLLRWQAAQGYFATGLSVAAVKTQLYWPFHLHCEGLIVGLLLAWFRRPSLSRHESQLASRGLAQRSFVVMLVLASFGIVLRSTDGVLFPFVALALIYGGLLWWLLDDHSLLSAPFRWRGWHLIARLSFGMYLNHLVWPHIGPDLVVSSAKIIGANAAALFVSTVGATLVSICVAALTFMLVEYPFLQVRRKLLSH